MQMCRPKTRPKTSLAVNLGFSLLEMLIVLTIMALMLSLMGARSITAIESTRFAATANSGIGSIKLLRAEAMLNERAIKIVNTDTHIDQWYYRHLNLPEGWQVFGNPIHISKTGICQGGRITLQSPGNRRATYELKPRSCEPTRITTQ